MVFTLVWVLAVYAPIVHMVWDGVLLSGDGPSAAIVEPTDFAAGLALVNTPVVTAGAILGWALFERIREQHVASHGMASGGGTGLVHSPRSS